MPVEILVGDSDKLTPAAAQPAAGRGAARRRLHVAERTGHMLTQERPQLVADAIERLLAAATAGRAAA